MTIDEAFFGHIASLHPGDDDFLWHCYAALVFQVNDQMDLVGETFEAALRRTSDQNLQLRMARQMREAMLKASVLVGFPKVMLSNVPCESPAREAQCPY